MVQPAMTFLQRFTCPKMYRWLTASLALMTLLGGLLASVAEAQGYRIKSGDQLTIEVLEDGSLNRSVLVLPGGTFDFPLAGTQRAGGLTVAQVRQNLSTALAPNFAIAPTVFVSVSGLAERRPAGAPRPPKMISTYITGEVNAPGKLDVEPGTTILQLIAQAGGLTRFAAETRIELRRVSHASGALTVYLFSYSGKANGPRISGGTLLVEGDVVVVPERRLFE